MSVENIECFFSVKEQQCQNSRWRFFRASIYLGEKIGFSRSGESTYGGFAIIWVAVDSSDCNGNSVIQCLWLWSLYWRLRIAFWDVRNQS